MMKIILLLLPVLFLNINNGPLQKLERIEFPIVDNISSVGIQVPPIIFTQRSEVVLTGEYFIVIEPHAEKIFSVFKLPDCTYLGGFGKLGRGPLEFHYPDAWTATRSPDGIKIFDVNKGLLYIDLNDFLFNKTYSINKHIRLPGELYPLNDAFQLNDSIICGIPYAGFVDKAYARYNIRSLKLDYFGEYPSLYPEIREKLFWLIYGRRSTVKPDESKFASFCWQVKMFRIYRNDGTLEKEVVMEKQRDFFDGEWIRMNPIKYYGAIKSTDNYIYALCENERTHNLLENIPTLEIWDWKGNPIACLKLDKSICTFDIDEASMKIYCIDRQITDKIFVYDLCKVLE